MKAAIKKLWLKALRSGKYSQTKQVLRSDTGYCCLGVLTDLYLKEKGASWRKTRDGEFACGREAFNLPAAVRKWAGFGAREKDPELPAGAAYDSLTSANDEGARFKTIANLIEKHL